MVYNFYIDFYIFYAYLYKMWNHPSTMRKGRMWIMSIKRIICVLIALAMLSFAFACGGETVGGGTQQPDGGGQAQQPGGGGQTQQPGGGGQPQQPGDGGQTPQPGDGGNEGTPAPAPGGGGTSTNLSGSPVEFLKEFVDELREKGVEMPMVLPPTEVEPELSHNTIGLEEEDFNRLVVSAAHNIAAIGTFAHQLIMIQAKDARAAGEVKGIVSGPDGYDPHKWICVWPERAIVMDSGEYVLIVAARAPVVEAAIDVFREMAGTIGTVVTFFEHDGHLEGEGGGGGGGFGGGPIGLG